MPCIFVSFKVGEDDGSDSDVALGTLPCLTFESDSSDRPLSLIQARTPALLKGIDIENMNEDLRSLLEKRATDREQKLVTDREQKLGTGNMEISANYVIRNQLEMLAEVAQGWLICEKVLPTGTEEMRSFYRLFRSGPTRSDCVDIKATLSSWKLGWWNEDTGHNQAPKGSIPVLAVSQIYGVVNNKDGLILVYFDTTQGKCIEQTLRLTCLNGGRNRWVEALQSFIKRLRAFRHQEQVDFFHRKSNRGKYNRSPTAKVHGAIPGGSSES